MALWSVTAAFGAYFCMYAFRKPFTSAGFASGTVFGLPEKTVLVVAQVLGYTLSKFIGIKVIAEMTSKGRALGILILIGSAEVALLLFGFLPAPLHVFALFLNGVPLGMVFGLVLAYLEGRKHTEALAAGLCASFIIADGQTKSVGTWLLGLGVSERWMPAAAGALFLPALLLFVWMLTRIPPPDDHDIERRAERLPMDGPTRAAFLKKYAFGLIPITIAYLAVTIVRSIRADFAPEIWKGLGVEVVPETFTYSEIFVAAGVLLTSGLSILIVDNRKAFFVSLGVCGFGALLMCGTLLGLSFGRIDAFTFMVLVGLGLYFPYAAVHTTVFERLIAMTREPGNLGFLLYLTDAVGYLGYVAILLGKGFLASRGGFLAFFQVVCWITGVIAAGCFLTCAAAFARRRAAAPIVEATGEA
ncbi:MAG: DUF5690 family protein [Isosphaeraceae bacterium]|nr:DUF5690 family protein [Isosphaeraceae bacterium]